MSEDNKIRESAVSQVATILEKAKNRKHTPLPYEFIWSETNSAGWRKGRLISEPIPNGQYNKTIMMVEHYPHNDGLANAEYIVKACNNFDKANKLLHRVFGESSMPSQLFVDINNYLNEVNYE